MRKYSPYFNSEGYPDPTPFTAINNLKNTDHARGHGYGHQYRPLVYVCSPYSGDTEKNTGDARKYSRFVIDRGCIPVTPHLLYPQMLDDSVNEERELGLFFGNVLMDKCKEVWVFGETVSAGMSAEIARAKRKNYTLRYFSSSLKETSPENASSIRAIQTEYRGYLFRSRLEARWAVFFDACGADWEYEPEGYDLGNGDRYLPDFLIHNVDGRAGGDLYVEVKGVMTEADAAKIKKFAESGFDSPESFSKSKTAVLVVGAVPPGDICEITDRICAAAYSSRTAGPHEYNFETIDGDYFAAVPGINRNGRFEVFGDNYCSLSNRDDAATEKAYRLARQARFEYGETPEIRGGTT